MTATAGIAEASRSGHFARLLRATGVYAAAAVAQRGLAFFLLPVYTRFIEPSEYGTLELLTVFSTIVFGILVLGLPSAIMKVFHRDCETAEEQETLLSTAFLLAAPLCLVGAAALFVTAPAVSDLLLGTPEADDLVQLALVTGLLTSTIALILSSLRAQERAIAFSVLSLFQVAAALTINVVLVVVYGMGIRGVLWGNLVSNALALPVALFFLRRSNKLAFSQRLAGPLLRFGLLMIPAMLSTWILSVSDRYMLRVFSGLTEVAVYGVGYKFGKLVELLAVWPFQLAWPALSFSISREQGHERTYAKTLTYLSIVLIYLVLGLSLTTRIAMLFVVGEGFREAYRVVPLIAFAYALNGVYYCIVPGIHIQEKTHYVTFIAIGAALANVCLNLAVIPRWGMMGAAWASAVAFLLQVAAVGVVGQRLYPVRYEYRKLVAIAFAGLVSYVVGVQIQPALTVFSVSFHLAMAILAFPAMLIALRVIDRSELQAVGRLMRTAWSGRGASEKLG